MRSNRFVLLNTILFVVLSLFGIAYPACAATGFNVRDNGARGDGQTVDTPAVQATIDAAAASGGTVYFPAGVYMCGSLHLKSHVGLRLDHGATIKGIHDIKAYDPYEDLGFKNASDKETSFFHQALIWGEGVEHISITGTGTIDSNFPSRGGPKAIALKRCKFVQIEGIHILNPPNYSISMLGTDNVEIDGVTILNAFADGIDPDACHNVRISNCHIESWDDAIVPKASFSLGERRSTENVTVTNCYLATGCNCFKLGTESGGDFKRIAVSNCVMDAMPGKRDANSGIALESVDGSNVDGVVISNITMVNVCAPIFIRLGNRGRDLATPTPGTLRSISIENIVATNASFTGSITGIPDHYVENVSISNVRISFVGGGPYRPVTESVPEQINEYPDADMFGALPGYALYARHVRGLTLSNVNLSWEEGYWRVAMDPAGRWEWPIRGVVKAPVDKPAIGNALLFEDVHDLRLDGLRAKPSDQGDAVVWMKNVQDALVESSVAMKGTETFLEISGSDTHRIRLIGNVLDDARTPVKRDKMVSKNALSLLSNSGAR